MCAIISSAVLKGPKPRPAFSSSSDSSRRASMMRRWAGVYSSSAFGNWARSITNLGVITILPRWKAKFTRSPLDSPAWRRTLVGMVTWPLCWIFAVVFIKIYSDEFRKSGIQTSACSIAKGAICQPEQWCDAIPMLKAFQPAQEAVRGHARAQTHRVDGLPILVHGADILHAVAVGANQDLSLIHISEPTRLGMI